jgi:hypothetical protein
MVLHASCHLGCGSSWSSHPALRQILMLLATHTAVHHTTLCITHTHSGTSSIVTPCSMHATSAAKLLPSSLTLRVRPGCAPAGLLPASAHWYRRHDHTAIVGHKLHRCSSSQALAKHAPHKGSAPVAKGQTLLTMLQQVSSSSWLVPHCLKVDM